MEIFDQLDALDLDGLDAADLYVLTYRLHQSAQWAAAAMLERSRQQQRGGLLSQGLKNGSKVGEVSSHSCDTRR